MKRLRHCEAFFVSGVSGVSARFEKFVISPVGFALFGDAQGRLENATHTSLKTNVRLFFFKLHFGKEFMFLPATRAITNTSRLRDATYLNAARFAGVKQTK